MQRLGKGAKAPLADALAKLEKKAAGLLGQDVADTPTAGPHTASLPQVFAELHNMLEQLQGSDAAPSPPTVAACGEVRQIANQLLDRWKELKDKDVRRAERATSTG